MVATGRFCSDKNAFEADHVYMRVFYISGMITKTVCLTYFAAKHGSLSIEVKGSS